MPVALLQLSGVQGVAMRSTPTIFIQKTRPLGLICCEKQALAANLRRFCKMQSPWRALLCALPNSLLAKRAKGVYQAR